RDARVRSMAGVMAGVMAGLTAALMAVIPAAAIPAFDKGRAPSVAVAIFQFGAAVLAAFGLDRLSAGADDPWPKRIAWAVLGFGVLIFAVYQALFFANKMTFPGDLSVLITAFLALLLAALLFGWKGGSLTRAQACVLMILLL